MTNPTTEQIEKARQASLDKLYLSVLYYFGLAETNRVKV